MKRTICVTCILMACLFIWGCEEAAQTGTARMLTAGSELGITIGSLAEVYALETIPVEGYGLVGGLRGKGSSECPPMVKAYLTQYILAQLPDYDVKKFIDSKDTSVVMIQGMMPAAISKNQSFDVRVAALPGTQTISLKEGWLYGADLKPVGGFSIATQVLAVAEGPVFINTIEPVVANERIGYILGGGRVLDEYKIALSLLSPDYRTANAVRNRLNERFGDGTAKSLTASQIELKVPAEYAEQKQRFISLVKSMYLTETEELINNRIITFVRKLAVSEQKEASEIALEVIGNQCLGKLSILLNSSDEEVRLRAARCMLNLGSDEGLDILRKIATDKTSIYRMEALQAIAISANRNDAAAISRRLLLDDDFDIVLAAYEGLHKLDDIVITQQFIADSFYLEQVAQTSRRIIYISRSGQPRIVLFGAPIYCREDIFVQSPNGEITINATSGQPYVSITSKHPKRPEVIAQLRTTFRLDDIIQTLCEEPTPETEQKRQGLGCSYTDAIVLLKQMCDKGAVPAEFRAGPMPKISLIIKK
ncbi:MAG: flagellar basal body P-ring protein FlgI [Planctomycetota bacterium]